MKYYHISAQTIRDNLSERLAENKAELEALKAVKINTTHTNLTNRAIEGGTVFNYLDINKAVRISYAVKYEDGHTRYMSREITAYSYYDEQGNEIGISGYLRISRTINPKEFKVILDDIIESVANTIGELEWEYKRAEKIAKTHNEIADSIEIFNNSLSYACGARI